MSVASLYTPCFVMYCVFLYGPFCHGAHKLDLSTLFRTFFLCTFLPFILQKETVNVFKLLNTFDRFLSYNTYLISTNLTQQYGIWS